MFVNTVNCGPLWCLPALVRSVNLLERCVDILHAEYEKVEGIRAESSGLDLDGPENAESTGSLN